MKKLFGSMKMGWLAVVMFAVVAGLYTGVVMISPMLKGTSLQDIGVTYEWWVIFAVIVVVNCKTAWEAMLKCFLFFLISQPLIYLVEIVTGSLTFDAAWYYYKNFWLPATVLTLPGGLVLYFCKTQNAWGGIILGLANTIQIVMGVHYVLVAIQNLPYHVFSAVVSFGSVFLMSFCVHSKKANRVVSLVLPVVLAAILITAALLTGRTI